MNVIGEMMRIGVPKGLAFHLIKSYRKGLEEKIAFFKWLVKEKKAYSHNYFIKIVENGSTGYYYDEFLQYKRDRETIEKLKGFSDKALVKHQIEEHKIGEDKKVKKRKGIFNFIDDE